MVKLGHEITLFKTKFSPSLARVNGKRPIMGSVKPAKLPTSDTLIPRIFFHADFQNELFMLVTPAAREAIKTKYEKETVEPTVQITSLVVTGTLKDSYRREEDKEKRS